MKSGKRRKQTGQPTEVTARDSVPAFDVFLSYASEDVEWCEQLAERLRNEGVRVWFDRWQIQPGDHLLVRINDGLEQSRKMLAVWSSNYFADKKVWTLAESFAQQQPDVLARDRPLIPLLIEDCDIPPLFRNIVRLDFQNPADEELCFRQLLQALDLTQREFAPALEGNLPSDELPRDELGRRSHFRGKRFEEEVATLYHLLGFETTQDAEVSGIQIDLRIRKREGGLTTEAIVECKDKRITTTERDQLLAQQNVVQRKLPKFRWVAVSSKGFAAETLVALEDSGFDCITYAELLRELIPLNSYVEKLIADYESQVADPERGWSGRDLFIRPDLETDITYEKRPALAHFAKWLGDPRNNLLVVLGDLGTGKTTLARFLAYQLARSFRDDPLRHPAPVLIPLVEVRKEVVLDSIVVKHFRDHGLPGLDFRRFEHLVRHGKIVLFFDAFDEMADRVRWDVTQSNFQELRRAAVEAGKVVLTCRTHYFKDRTEQIRLIGEGPSLTAAETALYKELRQQSGAEVAYLQEFSDDQILEYLRKTRGHKADDDWRKIQAIYNLRDLAQRPLLLEMIVKSLPKLHEGQTLNAANLYTVYTNAWIDRDYVKGRVVLNKETKLSLMMELAWRMWADEKTTFSTTDLVKFVAALHSSQTLEFGDEEVDDIVREVQAASFLRRERDDADFSFMHRSFGEFFLARRILEAFGESSPKRKPKKSEEELALARRASVLDVRRLDQKAVYFLTFLDERDTMSLELQTILTSSYMRNVSENALQILYWSGRVRCDMEDQISDAEVLRRELAERLPTGIQLAGAQLQEIALESAVFTGADFTGADLTKANLNGAAITGCRFHKAKLNETRAEGVDCENVDFRESDLRGAVFTGSRFVDCDFADALAVPLQFVKTSQMIRAPVIEARATCVNGRILPTQALTPVVQLGSPWSVHSVAWSRDADLLAVGGNDGVIRLYRPSDGKLLRTLEGHRKCVFSVAFDPQGVNVASGSSDSTVKLWEARSGKLLKTLEGHQDYVRSVAFDPQGVALASGNDDRMVRLWDTRSGTLLHTLEGHQDYVRSVAFDPQSGTLASASDDSTVKLWDARSCKLLRTLEGHHNVDCVAFDPEGETLASGSTDRTVKLWDARSGKLLRTLEGHPNNVLSVAFDPQGVTLASGSSDRTVKLWDVGSGKLLRTLEGHQDYVRSVAFDPHAGSLASGSSDSTVKLWDARSGKLLRTLEGHQDYVRSVAIDPQGGTLASGSDDRRVKLWDARNGKLLQALEGHQDYVRSVAFDPQGESLASGSDDRTVKRWEVRSGKLLRTLEGHQDSIRSVAFDPHGGTLASGSSDRTVKLWDARNGKLLRTLEGHQNRIYSVAFDPQGVTLASGSSDRTVKLWDASSGKLLRTLEGHQNRVLSLAFDPHNGTLASGSEDRTVMLWNTHNGRSLQTLEGHQDFVRSVAFDPQGGTLASASHDSTVKLWEARSGKLLRTLEGHLGPVSSVHFSTHGKYLVAAGAAGRLQFWDVDRGETFLYLYAFAPGAHLALLPDGRFDGTPEALRYLTYTERDSFNSINAEVLIDEFHSPAAVQEVLARYQNSK